jgi:NodT family efflux transporter outer membrane factor (OMF) lipoprotein
MRRGVSAGAWPGAALLLTGTLLSSACAQRAHYTPPAVDVTATTFKEDPNWKPATPADDVVRGHWWEQFNDASLNALEARVDISNQTLKAADARFAASRAVLTQTRASLSPQVTASPSISAAQQSGTRAVSTFHDVYGDITLPVDVSYEIDLWGRVHSAVSASTAIAQATAADLESVRLSLHAELAIDYFTLQALDRERSLLGDAVTSYERALELTRNRYNGGIVSAADVAQAEAQLEATRAQAIDIRTARAGYEHAMAVLVGEPASTFSIVVTPLDATTPPAIPGILPSQLLERRPDIASAERQVAAAHAQIGVATAARYPLVALSGAAGFESSGFGRLLTGASGLWSVGPAAVATLFDGGRRKAVVVERQAEYEETAADYRQTVLLAFREVEDQLASLRVLGEEAAVQARALEAAERSLALATNRYRGGVATYLEVIVAQNVALVSERTTVSLTVRRMTASVLLLKALGGDWTPDAMSAQRNASTPP